jgi:hypothetical protein
MEWNREALKSLTILSLSIFLSISISRLLLNISVIELWVVVVLFIAFITVFILYLRSDWVGEKIWTSHMRRKATSPIIGILHEAQCENQQDGHPYTAFLSADWNVAIRRLNLNTDIISIDQLSDKYSVIINPYGEVYPETDPISMSSFQRIKEYIRRGGIFVCAGGVPFFYCWDSRTHHRITLAKILQTYVQIGQNNLGQNVLAPTFFYPPPYSLMENPVSEHFGVNVIGDIQPPPNAPTGWQPIFQTNQANEDIQYVGNLAQIGGTNQVVIFRSILPITRCCIPFLRANIPNFTEVYPIAGIPYERGLLIVCGMNLNSGASIGNLNVDRAEFEKICHVISNLLDGIRRETISYNWKTGRN